MCILWAGVSTSFARGTSKTPVSVMGAVSVEAAVWMALTIAALAVAIGLGFLQGRFRLSKRASFSESHEQRVGPHSGPLPESEQRYRRLVEGFSRDYIMYSRGEDQILTYVSPSVKEVLGYEPGEMIGRDWRAFTDRQDPVSQQAAELGNQAIAGKLNEYVTECILHNAKGEPRYFEFHEWPVSDKKANIIATEGIAKDVTELKVSEARIWQLNAELAQRVSEQSTELQENAEVYRSLVENAPYCIHQIDLEGKMLSVNPAGLKMIGATEESEAIGQPFMMVVGEDDQHEIADLMERAFQGEASEFEFRSFDGHTFQSTFVPMTDAEGKIDRLMGITIDMTQRRQAEESLRESDEVYRSVVKNAPYCIHQIDMEGKMISVNPAGLRCIDATEESEAIGQPYITVVSEEDQDRIDNLMQRAFQGEASEFEFRSFNTRIWQSTFVPMKDADGNVERLMGITIDMTQRRQAEESLRESEQRQQDILDNATAVVFVKDLEGRYLTINRQFEKLFHLSKEEIVGKMDYEIFPRHTAATFRENDLQVMEAGHALSFEEVVPQDDGIHDYVAVKFPLFNGDGAIYAVCGIATDITPQVKLNEEKLLLQEHLHQAQRMETVGHLASGIAHDFNNLLFVISAHVQLVKRRWPGASEIAKSIKPIEEAVKQATNVSRSLIDFSKTHQPEKEFIDMGDAIRQAASMLRRLIPSSVDLTVDIPDQTIRIHADRTQLQQIVLNLVINACDAMPDGGELTVQVTREKTNAGDAKAILKVNDQGVGIPVENQARIFEPFFTTKAPDKGTGLGLSMVRRIVEEHSGAIEIQSKIGQGSTITIAFPCVDREPVANEPEIPTHTESEQGSGQVVLLAEDDTQVRGILAGELESLGYVVVQAIDGRELIERFHENRNRIELLFVDVDLPHQSGLECVRLLRKEGVELPAVIMTGSEKVQLTRQDTQVGPSILIQKPFELDDVGVEVQSLLHRSAETVS
jgi:PAS domain S-box-containing protein